MLSSTDEIRSIADEELETVIHGAFDKLRGRCCGLIESWGLVDKQERGAIQTLKQLTYDSEAAIINLLSE